MRIAVRSFVSALIMASLAILWLPAGPADGAFMYKSYVVRRDQGRDILCEPYIVQKNDWILKLFKQKGEMSQKDFPEFLNIFKRINPHIADLNRIQVGQNIFIPLKKIKTESLPGQSSGVVTIPFVTISNIQERLATFTRSYQVKPGDLVSRLMAQQYAPSNTPAYEEGMRLFKLLNPDVKDLNRIYVGQKLILPQRELQNQPWYAAMFDPDGNIVMPPEDRDQTPLPPPAEPASQPPVPTVAPDNVSSPLAAAASALGTRLLNRGRYFFPQAGSQDLAVDLSRFPLISLDDGTRLLFTRGDRSLPAEHLAVMQRFWPKLRVVPQETAASAEYVMDSILESFGGRRLANRLNLSENGIDIEVRARWMMALAGSQNRPPRKMCITLIDDPDQRTPASIVRYLKNHGIVIKDIYIGKTRTGNPTPDDDPQPPEAVVRLKANGHRGFVADLLTALAFPYSTDVSITFPYAGVQVVTRSNLISLPDTPPVLVDFGELYGDAAAAIEKTGFRVVQIGAADRRSDIIRGILESLELEYRPTPVLTAAPRAGDYNTSLAIPGFLVGPAREAPILLTPSKLHPELIRFINAQDIKIIMLPANVAGT